MLPTIEEQDEKLSALLNEHCLHNLQSIVNFTKEYAKWYAEQVIKHCAEVAKVSNRQLDKGFLFNNYWQVDKQSILDVINEL